MGATIKRLIPLLALLFLFVPSQSHAAIAHDANSYSGSGNSGTSYTWSHVTGSGLSNSIIVCSEAGIINSSGMGMKYGGTSLTQVGVVYAGGGYNVWIGYLMNPSSGSTTVEADFGASQSAGWSSGGCATFSGVDQTNPVDSSGCTVSQAVGTSVSCNVTTVNANAWIVDVSIMSAGIGGTWAANSPQVIYWQNALFTNIYGEGASYQGPIATPASTSDGFNNGAISSTWSMAAFSLKPAGASTVTYTPSLLGADVLDRIEIIGYMFLVGISLGHARSKQLEKRVVDDGSGLHRVLSGPLRSPVYSFARLAKGSEATGVRIEVGKVSQGQERDSESSQPGTSQLKVVD